MHRESEPWRRFLRGGGGRSVHLELRVCKGRKERSDTIGEKSRMLERHFVPGWGFLSQFLEVMGSHGRFLSKVRPETQGKLLVGEARLQMGQGWSNVEGGGDKTPPR